MEHHDEGESLSPTYFHPGTSSISDEGKIVMMAGGYSHCFGMWDGSITMEPSDPDYQMWLWVRLQEKWQSREAIISSHELDSVRREFIAHGRLAGG